MIKVLPSPLDKMLSDIEQAVKGNEVLSGQNKEPDRQNATILYTLYQTYQTEHAFAPGDLVMWKPGLANRRYPHLDDPAVVVDILNEPVFPSSEEGGTPYFKEPLTLKIGMVIQGDFCIFHVDKNRFQPYVPTIKKETTHQIGTENKN